MSFDRPIWLLALLVVPAAAGLYLLAERRRMRYALRYTNLDVLARVVGGRPWRRYVAPALFLLALALLCVAVARPQAETLVADERATVILVIDVSRSMGAQDVKPTRLEAAKAAARTFLGRVPERLRVSLIIFSGDVQVAAPPTSDHRLVRDSIDAIEDYAGFGGTAIGDAIDRAVEVGQRAVDDRALTGIGSPPKPALGRPLVSIVFLSDGRQNRGVIPPLQGAARAKAAGFPVHTVALGTPNGELVLGMSWRAVPDPATLRAIARMTGGRFFEARSAKSLSAAYEKLGSRLGRRPGRTEVTNAFLAGAAALLVAAGLVSARWSPRLP